MTTKLSVLQFSLKLAARFQVSTFRQNQTQTQTTSLLNFTNILWNGIIGIVARLLMMLYYEIYLIKKIGMN